MDLFVYNTLTKKVEKFVPFKYPVGMYTCGPTVYDFAHIGNFRTYIVEDLIKRTLMLNGYKVVHVMNITDVGHLTDDQDQGEDKVELSAQKEKKSAWEIAEFYTDAFLNDLKKLNILMPDYMPKATEHIKEMIDLIKILEKKGYTYRTSDGIYFDTSKLKDYGKLVGKKIELIPGLRVEIGEKKNPTDFALWKFSPKEKKRQMEWDSPWGVGFPGWHIECSAMSMKYLGEQFDIHCGGIDHIPVHHTNEIAQSETATEKIPFVFYWIHVNFLVLKNQKKMAKSEGNVILVKDLQERGFSPLDFRYLVLSCHYQSFLEFSFEALESSKNSLKRLREIVSGFEKKEVVNDFWKNKILEKINDNFNFPEALSNVWTMLRSDLSQEEKIGTLLYFDQIFGLNLDEEIYKKIDELPEEIRNLIQEREILRKNKNFIEADKIREKIRSLGYEIIDTISGPKVRKSTN